MKTIIKIILIAVATYVLSPFFPWWTCAIFAFIISFMIPSTMLNAFVAGFLGVGLVWLAQSWSLDVANQSSFSSSIAQIMQLKNPFYLILASGAIGALTGGFAAMTGASFRHIFIKKPKQSFYS